MNEDFFENAEEKLRQSWEVHRQAFGPIIEPAFAEDTQARIHLIAALNKISRRKTKEGLVMLKSLEQHCVYDEDKAALFFFVGLAYEMAGNSEQMLKWYKRSCEIGHRFYMPYAKIAKYAHMAARFDESFDFYGKAVECILKLPEEDRELPVVGASYVNMCSCLTMMHRYAEAERVIHEAKRYPLPPGYQATHAILYAALDNEKGVGKCIDELKLTCPEWIEHISEMTSQIMTGTHPHFCYCGVAPIDVQDFWRWFITNEAELLFGLKTNGKSVVSSLKEKLRGVFPFMEKEPGFVVRSEGALLRVTFYDYYAIALHFGYEELISGCPKELCDRWSFNVEH